MANFLTKIFGTHSSHVPKITDADTIKMPQELLKSMISQTLFAVADSTAKPIHQGSLFKIENGNLDVVSVDGYRLALRREAINYANNTEFVVPGKTLSEVECKTGIFFRINSAHAEHSRMNHSTA